MTANYILLERIELAASAASITFSNIPQSGYTDLKIVMSTRLDVASTYNQISINGSTSTFSSRVLSGNGGAAGSFTDTPRYAGNAISSSFTASTFSNTDIYIPNYTGSTYKSYSIDSVSENNGTTSYADMTAGLWSTTSAITSITFTASSGNYVAGSTFSIYGLAAVGTTPAIAPKASGGNIATDGTYWYHTFLSSGTFTPQVNLTCDVLQVAGAGGAGGVISYQNGTGGGGAGGLLIYTSTPLVTSNYSVTVGAGGAGGTTAGIRGTNGSNTTFGALTASVGGGGGGGYSTGPLAGAAGGSGGGGCSSGSGGAATSGQGFAGGNGSNPSPYAGGGGGGAGAVGAAAGATAGNGGMGFYNSLTDAMGAATKTGQLSSTHYYYAGGGGGGFYEATSGGAGGLGGGASAAYATNGASGTANTGGGGAGTDGLPSTARTGGAGGSGIVIIRYPIA